MKISQLYLEEQQRLHENPNYGMASVETAPLVADIADYFQAESIADYGAGKCHLQTALKKLGRTYEYYPYDPVFPEYGAPKKADLVCCIDVLEHIEPEFLDEVLDELRSITTRHAFFTVHTGPAQKTLSDGRNAHIIQEKSSWWLPKLCERFEIFELKTGDNGFWVVAEPRA